MSILVPEHCRGFFFSFDTTVDAKFNPNASKGSTELRTRCPARHGIPQAVMRLTCAGKRSSLLVRYESAVAAKKALPAPAELSSSQIEKADDHNKVLPICRTHAHARAHALRPTVTHTRACVGDRWNAQVEDIHHRGVTDDVQLHAIDK